MSMLDKNILSVQQLTVTGSGLGLRVGDGVGASVNVLSTGGFVMGAGVTGEGVGSSVVGLGVAGSSLTQVLYVCVPSYKLQCGHSTKPPWKQSASLSHAMPHVFPCSVGDEVGESVSHAPFSATFTGTA